MKTAVRTDTTSFGATYNGVAMGLDNMDGYSVCIAWGTGGSPVGVLKLQASNNAFVENGNLNLLENSSATWVDISGSSNNVTTDGNYFWNVSDVFYRAFRIVYTRTSGTANATAFIFTKGAI